MAVTLKGQTAVYEGTSTDTKPTDADNNAIFKELDTGIRYYYDGTDWNEIPSSGGGGGGTGTDNYNELNNKPSINGTVLSGNKSLDNLGIQAKLTFDSAPTEDSENPVESGGVYSALAGKQDTLSSEQLDAVNSGITSADVEQITTNKNNISSLETKANTNIAIISQTYNSADCNMSLYLTRDDGGTTGSLQNTHYDTATSKMNFVVGISKNQYKYWDNEIEKYKYRYISVGLIATNNASKARELTLSIPPVANETYIKIYNYSGAYEDDGSNNNKAYQWNKNSVNIGDIWYIRPHIEYTDLETGMEYTMYGAVYKVTAGVPCTIECDTLSCTELTQIVGDINSVLEEVL